MTTETLAPDQHDLCCSNWDLVARSTLPEIQISYTSQQLVESVASALLPMLDAEFAFVSAGQRHGGSSVEAVRTRDPTRSGLDAWTRHSLYEIAAARRTGEPAVIPNPIDENTLRLAMASIGHGDGGILIVASPRSGFPSDVQKPILVMAAEETALGFDRWRFEREERRFAVLAENSPDFIGLANLEGFAHYVKYAGLRLVGLVELPKHGMWVADFVASEERRRLTEEFWPAILEKGRWSGDLHFQHFGDQSTNSFFVEAFRIGDPYIDEPMNR